MATAVRTTSEERSREGADAALETLKQWLPEPITDGVALGGYDISVSFGGVHANRDVTVEVPAQKFVGLMGPNGAGKSTFFDVLNGFTAPKAGRVMLFGEDVTTKPPWYRAEKGIGRTFQANHIDIDQIVFTNLLVGCHLHIRGGLVATTLRLGGSRRDEDRAREATRAVARLLDLDLVLDVPARFLDFGAQRRIEIGRSLLSRPQILLLDEPSAGFDSHESGALFKLVSRLQRDLGLPILLIEHYVDAVLEYCNPIYVLDQGALIAVGTPDEIAADPAVRAAYLGETR
jgi:ABC-type branched-subunit amino acid transport system ATPase component